MNIAIGNDHTAVALKKHIVSHLQKRGAEVTDFGTDDSGRSEYPWFAEQVASAVANGKHELGILLCGTGIGMSLAANKVRGIRAVVCSEPYSAKLSREHNDANILCIGARVVGDELAVMIVDTWLDATFQGGRHQERVDMIMEIERKTHEL